MKKEVIVLGGGFCGITAAKILENKKEINLTLIDKKSYFEYSPGLHELVAQPNLYKNMIIPFKEILKNTNLIHEKVEKVEPGKVKTEKRTKEFDYLIIGAGANYPIFIEDRNVFTVTSVENTLNLSKKVRNSESIAVIGGGPIGTEVTGEIITKTSNKEVTLIHLRDRLLERGPKKGSYHAKKFLKENGAKVVLGEKIVEHPPEKFLTGKGKEIEADLGIWCGGIKPNIEFMEGFEDSIYSENDALKVDNKLKLSGHPNIFAGGDINSIPEEKTAHNAEIHGYTIAENIIRSIKGKNLIGHDPQESPLLISLGSQNGMINFQDWTLNGYPPLLMKDLVRKWTMAKLKSRKLSKLEKFLFKNSPL